MNALEKARGERNGASRRQAGAVNVAAVVGALILIALVAYGLYRMRETSSEPEAASSTEADSRVTPFTGAPITASAPVALSPRARVAAERYRCVCGCNDPLSECTCRQKPGSIDMKEHLQDLVDRGLSTTQVDEGMVAKYGEQVLLSNPPAEQPPTSPGP